MKTALMQALLDAATKRDQYLALTKQARKKHREVLKADELVRQLRGLQHAKAPHASGRAA